MKPEDPAVRRQMHFRGVRSGHETTSGIESTTARCRCLNSESSDSRFVSHFWAGLKIVGSSAFVSSSDKWVESFVMEALITLLLRRVVAVGLALDIRSQIVWRPSELI